MSSSHPIIDVIRTAATDALAVVGPERTLSYRGLLAEIETTAATLRAAGVTAADTVALRSYRELHLPVTLLALWEIGAAVALVDSSLPAARIAECEAIVRPGWSLDREDLERHDGAGEHAGSHVLFTSGTTGRPAAVAVGPDALVRMLGWYTSTFTVNSRDRVALLGGLGHDPLLRDILVPLTAGGVLVVPPADAFGKPSVLVSFLRDSGITILHCTPALLELALAGGITDDFSSLRLIVSGGAPLTVGLARRLRAVTGATLVNAYGATETPQIASCMTVPDDLSLPDDAVLGVGSGVNGAELLLDGDRGEVVVRSPNLARGYLDGTGRRAKFIDDPLGQLTYRAYRTGDRGELAPDGGIRIVGRIDREVSINGYRVALEEVEHAAGRHPMVRQAQASLVSGAVGDLIGLSVVPMSDGDALDAKSIRGYLRSVLPQYAVPSQVRVVPGLELDHNHKLRSSHV